MPDSTGPAMRIAFFVFVAAIGTALTGCGQKGPLYMRDNPPPNVKPVKPDQYKPVPYPKGSPADAEPEGSPATK